MKNILFSLMMTVVSVASFAGEPIAKIEKDKAQLHLVNVATMPVNARLVYTPFSPGSPHMKMTIENVNSIYHSCHVDDL